MTSFVYDMSLALLPVEEAARRLSIARTKAYELIKAGELQSVKVGRVRRVPAAAVDDYVRRLTSTEDDLLTAASASLYARVKAFSDDLVRRGYMVSYRLSESGLRADIEVRLAHEVAAAAGAGS